VLHFESAVVPFAPATQDNPFLAFREYLAVDSLGEELGLSSEQRVSIISDTDERVARVAGTGFHKTPFLRSSALSDELGFSASGGIWVKDETGNVGGSHKARHIYTELLHLLFVEAAGRAPWPQSTRPRLAIASCGNAAIAASTLAAAMQWPISVHVPPTASPSVVATLTSLGADIVVCPRQPTDPPGDPCVLRFREAVAGGAIPFGVQGTENAWCLDGGRTIGWEMAEVLNGDMNRIFVQAGGGALAACVGDAFRSAGVTPRFHAVQTQGCAPLSRAWSRARDTGGARDAGPRWNECMWPWETEPVSFADGILDDETYDWISILNAMDETQGSPVVVTEAQVHRAYELIRSVGGFDSCATGVSGFAGLLAMRDDISHDERIVVIVSGVAR
jgi:threonine dehydratase